MNTLNTQWLRTHTHTHISSITIHTWLSSVLPASVCGPHGTNTIFWRLIWNRFTKIYLFLRLIGGQVVKHSFSHRVCKLVQILLMFVSTRGLHQHGWNLWKCKVKWWTGAGKWKLLLDTKKKKKTMIEATIVQRGCNYVYSLWEGFVICPYMGIMIIDFSTCNGNLYCSNAWWIMSHQRLWMRRSISILKPLAVNAVYNTSMKMNCKQKHNERRGCAGCSYRGQQRAEKCGKSQQSAVRDFRSVWRLAHCQRHERRARLFADLHPNLGDNC